METSGLDDDAPTSGGDPSDAPPEGSSGGPSDGPPGDAPDDPVERHLIAALDLAEDDSARFHLRQALQLLEIRD